MKPEQFVYWLQGYLEIQDPKEIDEHSTKVIKDHLDLVFTKLTPDRKRESESKGGVFFDKDDEARLYGGLPSKSEIEEAFSDDPFDVIHDGIC